MQMHVAQRQSIPNLPAAPTQAASLPPVIAFDSLKSLPQRDYLQPHYESQQTPPGTIFTLSIMQKTLLGSAVCRGTRPHLAATVDIELRNVVDMRASSHLHINKVLCSLLAAESLLLVVFCTMQNA